MDGGVVFEGGACVLEDDVAFAGFGSEGFDQGVRIVRAVEQGEDRLLDDVEGDVFVARVGGPGASGGCVGAGDFERAGAFVEGHLRGKRDCRDLGHTDQEHLEQGVEDEGVLGLGCEG